MPLTDKGEISHSLLRKYWLYGATLPLTHEAVMKTNIIPEKQPEVIFLDKASDVVKLDADFFDKMGIRFKSLDD